MRNLKKILAVICVVAMMASIAIVPALAAGFANEAQATTLNTLGVMAGMNLGDEVTRIQGLTFAIKAAGKDAAAQALTQAEVDAALANVVDAKDIPAWGQKYAAYAVTTAMTTGVDASVAPKIKFAPLQAISGDSFLVWTLKSMGYTTVGTANAWETAVTDAKVLTLSQGYTIHGAAKLIRDDVAGILYGALDNGVCKDGKAFVDTLIAAGMFTQQAAADAGLTTPPAPVALKVDSVAALNNKQILITFNMEVDKDSATAEANYTIGALATTAYDVQLQADKKSVIVDLNAAQAQQSTLKVTVKTDVKQAADKTKSCTELKEQEIRFLDTAYPTFSTTEVRGPKTIRVFVSEPVQTLDASKIKVNNGTVGLLVGGGGTAAGISSDKSQYYVDVQFVADMTTGTTYNIEFGEGAIQDYAAATGFSNLKTTIAVAYAKVTTPVNASISEAGQTSVKIKFSAPVDASKLSTNLFYHSLSTYKPNSFSPVTGFNDEYTLTFTSYPLPAGSVNLYIKNKDGSNEIVDGYGNKFVSDSLALTASVTADTAAPVVKEVKADPANKIVVSFDETVNSSDAQNRLNYTIKKSDGTVLTSAPADSNGHPTTVPVYSSANKNVTITLASNLTGGNYYLDVKSIRDTSLAENKLDTTTVAFTVKDTVAPALSSAEIYNDNKVIVVKFDKQMGASATDASNYQFDVNGTRKGLPSGTTLVLSSDGKAVTITMPSTIDNLDGAGDTVYVANVKDVNDNSIAFGSSTAVGTATAAGIVALDGKNGYFEQKDVLVFYFDKELSSIDGQKITYDTNAIAGASFINEVNSSGGNTSRAKVIVTLASGAMTGTDGAGVTNIVFAQDALTAANGKKTAAAGITVAMASLKDKLAPEIAKSGDNYRVETADTDANGYIDEMDLTFTEPLNTGDVSLTSFEVSGYTVSAVNTATSKVVKLTLDEKTSYDTSAVPALVIKGTVRDVAGNTLATTGTVSSVDKAAPVIVSAIYVDTNADVTVNAGDKVEITYSEGVKLAGSAVLADLANDFDLAGDSFGATPTFEVVGDRVIVTLGGAGIAITPHTSTINVTATSANVSIADSANSNNAVPAAAAVDIVD